MASPCFLQVLADDGLVYFLFLCYNGQDKEWGDGMTTPRENDLIFHKMSVYLNCEPSFVTPEMMRELTEECGLAPEEAFSMLVASRAGLDIDGEDQLLYRRYFPTMIRRLEIADFLSDPYLSAIRLPDMREGEWEFRHESYAPYEAFVCDDPVTLFDGRVVPQIGFFEETFSFPAVLEGGREWMTVTPNEMVTMRGAIAAAHGQVLTFGLGLGYFAYMAARRRQVDHVTVVEHDPDVIRLYHEVIAPQIPFADKIVVLREDAFRFAEERMGEGGYDMVFADIWHDPSDGVDAYRRLKACEKYLPGADYHYWIEKTLQLYM